MSGGQADHERSVVIELCQAASLPLEEQLIRQPDPPEPDVLCVLDDQKRYFELGRLLDSQWPRLRKWGRRNPGRWIKPNLEQIGMPERDVLVKKLGNSYETGGIPCDLLLYYDADIANPHLAGGIPPIPFPELANQVMLPILEQSMGPFERVWVYERYRQTVLWRFPVEKVDAA